jgi:hypothetical protein
MKTHISGNNKSLKADNLNTKEIQNKWIAEKLKELKSCNNPSFKETSLVDEETSEVSEPNNKFLRVNLLLF